MRWLDRCREWVARYDPVRPDMLEGEFHHYGFMRSLSEALPANAIVVADTGGNVIMMGHCFRSKRGQRIFASNGNSAMGTGFCGAIGAWFAEPTRPIICIIGDGGMGLNSQEMQTVVHYGVKLKIFVLQNYCLGNTRAWQVVNKRAQIGCGPDGYSSPNFCALAKAYGIAGMTVDNWRTFAFSLAYILEHDEALLVEVIDPYRCNYEPRVSKFDLPIEEMFPPLPGEEFWDNMIIPPVEGWNERRLRDTEMPDV